MKSITIEVEDKDYELLLLIAKRLGIEVHVKEKKGKPEYTLSKHKGILTAEEANTLQEYLKKSREEWDRNT